MKDIVSLPLFVWTAVTITIKIIAKKGSSLSLSLPPSLKVLIKYPIFYSFTRWGFDSLYNIYIYSKPTSGS